MQGERISILSLFILNIISGIMADKTYQLNIRINTPEGEQLVAKFFLGNSPHDAHYIFEQLEDRDTIDKGGFIYFEFAEVDNGLPVNLKIITCDLDQASANMKLILKELFKNSLL